jgi:hypothetical protein
MAEISVNNIKCWGVLEYPELTREDGTIRPAVRHLRSDQVDAIVVVASDSSSSVRCIRFNNGMCGNKYPAPCPYFKRSE